MSKRTSYETMKSFSWIYIIVAAFYISVQLFVSLCQNFAMVWKKV